MLLVKFGVAFVCEDAICDVAHANVVDARMPEAVSRIEKSFPMQQAIGSNPQTEIFIYR